MRMDSINQPLGVYKLFNKIQLYNATRRDTRRDHLRLQQLPLVLWHFHYPVMSSYILKLSNLMMSLITLKIDSIVIIRAQIWDFSSVSLKLRLNSICPSLIFWRNLFSLYLYNLIGCFLSVEFEVLSAPHT